MFKTVIAITKGRADHHDRFGTCWAKLNHPMNDFAILTNRKRGLIALIHSVVFLAIALHGFAAPKLGILAPGTVATGDIVLIVIYLTVASILTWLATISRCVRERIYFLLCTSSATFGLLRTVFGDAALPAAQYLRVLMLLSAVILGSTIVRSFYRPVVEPISAD
jgi:hypothetical protein